MALIRMVRHGEAAAGYGEHADPGLSERGQEQAARVADDLVGLGPLSVVSSPMLRARETAAPLAALWGVAVAIEPSVSEIPTPDLTIAERSTWLRTFMGGTWNDAPAHVQAWRTSISDALLAFDTDTVVFSHFVSTNAAIGLATDAAKTTARHLDHCSVTTFDTSSGSLVLVDAGSEAATTIL